MCQTSRTHGPAATTTCSHAMLPRSVTTLETAPPSLSNPVTVAGAINSTPSASPLARRPSIDGMLSAYPPFFSCRTTVTFLACQSEKIDSM